MFPVRVLWNVQKTESWFYVVRQSCAENQHDWIHLIQYDAWTASGFKTLVLLETCIFQHINWNYIQ